MSEPKIYKIHADGDLVLLSEFTKLQAENKTLKEELKSLKDTEEHTTNRIIEKCQENKALKQSPQTKQE